MKKQINLIRFLLMLLSVNLIIIKSIMAQAPEKMGYQALIRNGNNEILQNTQLDIKISILHGSSTGTAVYIETQSPVTNANGLVNLQIGTGTHVYGVFLLIDWTSGPYFIKIETKLAGEADYTLMGTSQLISVPYAFYAKMSDYDNLINKPVLFDGNYNSLTNKPNLFDGTWGSLTGKPALATVATSGSYADLSNKPTLFDGNYNSLTNKPTLFDGTWSSLTGKPTFATVATSGSYADLSNKPTLFDGNYNSLTNKPSLFDGTWGSLTGKPTLATVATSGSYADLSGLPILFDGDYNSLTNKPILFNGTWISLSGKPNTIGGFGITDFDFTGAQPNDMLKYNGSKWVKFTPNFLTSYTETDPIFEASASNNITTENITNWNSAYGWGNHAGLYKPITYLPAWGEITDNPFSINEPLDKQFLRYNAITGKWENFTPDYITGGDIHNDSLYLTHNTGAVSNAGYIGRTAIVVPTLIIAGVFDLTYTGCTADGNITSSGGEYVVSRGFCISSGHNPKITDTVFACGSGAGPFTGYLTGMKSNHTYYIKAYATNIAGTSYSDEMSFNTNALTLATLTTNTVYNISQTTAMSGGNIIADGGSAITERGICWSLSHNPTTADNKNAQGTGTGSFNAQMSSLTQSTTYYVRAYAVNSVGTAYGDEQTFTTTSLSLASITTNTVSSISYTTAVSGGNVTADNGSSVTSRGICWATTTMPTTANTKYTEAAGLGSFSASMTGLTPATTYYVRAFAVNAAGTVYGSQYSFTTLALAAPTLTTKSISGISSNIAGSGGDITSDGGAAITSKGVCWSFNHLPTKANSYTSDGTGTTSYNSTMNGLTPLTLYYVRAYATNSVGTTYGNELSFTTTDLVNPGPQVPTVGTSTSTITGSSTASSGGYVSSDGGSTVTMRGVCWSTSQNPTLANSYTSDGGSGTGYFTSTITGLSGCGTVYYVRAYATNSTGTGYGNQNTVSTGLLPSVTTDDVSSISYYTAVSGGNIPDNGGCPITQKGICWNYSPSPTTANNKTTEGAGSGAFVSNITGLYANRTYYVRAYATNSVGTVYGPEKVFTTTTPSSLYIGQNYAGGIIFYIDGTGEHGLVCASTDQGSYYFGCDGTSIATGTALGTGASNTAAIVASCAASNTAAKICDNLTLNGYSDWFLPSLDEAFLMFNNIAAKGLGNFQQGYTYITSSENAADRFYYVYTYGGSAYSGWDYKRNGYLTRAVRAF